MAFHFSLESVLRYRRGIERQQELLLTQANQRIAQIESHIAAANSAMRTILETEARELETGCGASEMQFHQFCLAMLSRQKRDLQAILGREETIRRERMLAFRKARQLRAVIEKLREQQLTASQQEAARREQAQLDDLFLTRRAFAPQD